MSSQKERFSVSFSQDEDVTRVIVNLPTKIAKVGIQKAILFLTGGSVFWISTHLPIVLPQKPLPESQPIPTQVNPPSFVN